MLGFSVDCSRPERVGGCAFAEKVAIPTSAYSLKCGATNAVNQCPFPLPGVQAASISLEQFRQW